ncbi:MAG TPA: hypothetical protein VHP57_04160 [Acidimicrobiia bacterium]|nr:hypothetical protein [Acidimicrobiia bacterium]
MGIVGIVGIAGCIPSAPTGNWTLFGGGQASNTSGANPPVLVVGDSLVFWSGPNNASGVQAYADNIRLYTGRSATVGAAAAASYTHFTHSALLAGTPVSTIQDYVSFLSPRLTVLALGTNDARLLAGDTTNAFGYTQSDFQASANTAISSALTKSFCVVAVNVTTRSQTGAPFIAQAAGVNNYLAQTAGSSGGRVRLADWNSYSASHPEWFDTGDAAGYHQSDSSGKAAYRQFIIDQINAAFATGHC